MAENQFLGTWRLVSLELRDAEGQAIFPYGQDAIGYLMYTADGYMSAHIMKAHRSNFVGFDMLAATQEEQAIAAQSYIAYCGLYEIQCNKVIHHVQASLFPNWVGVSQERFFEFKGERLVLSTPPLQVAGKQQTAHLIWEHS
jgi:hypothetical protein